MDEEVLNAYCWMYGTFDIPSDFKVKGDQQINLLGELFLSESRVFSSRKQILLKYVQLSLVLSGAQTSRLLILSRTPSLIRLLRQIKEKNEKYMSNYLYTYLFLFLSLSFALSLSLSLSISLSLSLSLSLFLFIYLSINPSIYIYFLSFS